MPDQLATLERVIAQARSTSEEVTVILADLDRLDEVNSRHGRAAGDEALRVCADTLRRHVRSSDISGRFDGGTFLLVLCDTSYGVGANRAETLRAAVVDSAVSSGDATFEVTASFGIATFPHHGETADALVAAAGDALDAAKATGGDSVAVAKGIPQLLNDEGRP